MLHTHECVWWSSRREVTHIRTYVHYTTHPHTHTHVKARLAHTHKKGREEKEGEREKPLTHSLFTHYHHADEGGGTEGTAPTLHSLTAPKEEGGGGGEPCPTTTSTTTPTAGRGGKGGEGCKKALNSKRRRRKLSRYSRSSSSSPSSLRASASASASASVLECQASLLWDSLFRKHHISRGKERRRGESLSLVAVSRRRSAQAEFKKEGGGERKGKEETCKGRKEREREKSILFLSVS